MPSCSSLRTTPLHRIVFVGSSKRHPGYGTATVESAMSLVPGALYRMFRSDLHELDRQEGCPIANHRHNDWVYDYQGNRHEAYMYREESGSVRNHPHPEYLAIILRGRRYFGFPVDDLLKAAEEG